MCVFFFAPLHCIHLDFRLNGRNGANRATEALSSQHLRARSSPREISVRLPHFFVIHRFMYSCTSSCRFFYPLLNLYKIISLFFETELCCMPTSRRLESRPIQALQTPCEVFCMYMRYPLVADSGEEAH